MNTTEMLLGVIFAVLCVIMFGVLRIAETLEKAALPGGPWSVKVHTRDSVRKGGSHSPDGEGES